VPLSPPWSYLWVWVRVRALRFTRTLGFLAVLVLVRLVKVTLENQVALAWAGSEQRYSAALGGELLCHDGTMNS